MCGEGYIQCSDNARQAHCLLLRMLTRVGISPLRRDIVQWPNIDLGRLPAIHGSLEFCSILHADLSLNDGGLQRSKKCLMSGVSQSADLERLVSNEDIAIKCKAEFSALKEGCICLRMLPICRNTFDKTKESSCCHASLRAKPYHCHTKATWQIPQRGRACLQAALDCQFCMQPSVISWVLHLASSNPVTKKYF